MNRIFRSLQTRRLGGGRIDRLNREPGSGNRDPLAWFRFPASGSRLLSERELLDAAARRSLANVEVASAVNAHAMRPEHLPDMPSAVTERTDDLEVAAAQDPHLVIGPVGQVEPLLIGIGR